MGFWGFGEAFLLIVIGVIYGKGTGFTGRAVVVEGKTWIDAQANYDGELRTGRFFSGDFTGVGLRLRGFEDTYRQSGQPMDFVSHVDLLDPQGNVVKQADIRVNEPASIDGVEFFQYGFGWAPVVEIRQGGDLIASEPITFVQDTAPEGVPQLAMPWRGILKLPSLDPQMGMTLVLWPDSRAWLQLQTTGQPVAMTQSFQPIMFYKVYRGDLTDTVRSIARHERDAQGGARASSAPSRPSTCGPGRRSRTADAARVSRSRSPSSASTACCR